MFKTLKPLRKEFVRAYKMRKKIEIGFILSIKLCKITQKHIKITIFAPPIVSVKHIEIMC